MRPRWAVRAPSSSTSGTLRTSGASASRSRRTQGHVLPPSSRSGFSGASRSKRPRSSSGMRTGLSRARGARRSSPSSTS
eukprot:5960933-Alexandrium_andersonii.AAC.1